MASSLPTSEPLKATPRANAVSRIFRRINARIEPRIRSGFASPGLLPAGLIVLETTGRRSGDVYRTPLLATLGPGGYLWVNTVLGHHANWLRNARAHSGIRYWLKGRAHNGRAIVSAPGLSAPDLSSLPPLLRWAAERGIKTSRALGFGTLIIVPVPDEPSA